MQTRYAVHAHDVHTQRVVDQCFTYHANSHAKRWSNSCNKLHTKSRPPQTPSSSSCVTHNND